MNNPPIPLSQHSAYLLSALIIAVIIGVNILNSIINARAQNKRRYSEQDLQDISKQLLIQAGYLKNKNEDSGKYAQYHNHKRQT